MEMILASDVVPGQRVLFKGEYRTVSPEEAAAEVAEMEARADRDELDRADRWGGWWDDQD